MRIQSPNFNLKMRLKANFYVKNMRDFFGPWKTLARIGMILITKQSLVYRACLINRYMQRMVSIAICARHSTLVRM